jgi:hypothetical protein
MGKECVFKVYLVYWFTGLPLYQFTMFTFTRFTVVYQVYGLPGLLSLFKKMREQTKKQFSLRNGGVSIKVRRQGHKDSHNQTQPKDKIDHQYDSSYRVYI